MKALVVLCSKCGDPLWCFRANAAPDDATVRAIASSLLVCDPCAKEMRGKAS